MKWFLAHVCESWAEVRWQVTAGEDGSGSVEVCVVAGLDGDLLLEVNYN